MVAVDEIIMGLILNAGNAKEHIYNALNACKKKQYEKVDDEISLAEKALNDAHNVQSAWLAREAGGESADITALFVHAQDHLMTTMTEINLIKEIIELRQEIDAE